MFSFQLKRDIEEKSSRDKKRQKLSKNLASLPNEILDKIFQYLVLQEGDQMIYKLSTVCKHFYTIVKQESFRRSVHFSWLKSIYKWSEASIQFKEENYVMYEIKDCVQCGTKYKDMYGFLGHGIL